MHTGQRDGLNFFEALTLVLIVLKLCGIIEWAWVLVLSPILFPLIVAINYVFIKSIKSVKKGK